MAILVIIYRSKFIASSGDLEAGQDFLHEEMIELDGNVPQDDVPETGYCIHHNLYDLDAKGYNFIPEANPTLH